MWKRGCVLGLQVCDLGLGSCGLGLALGVVALLTSLQRIFKNDGVDSFVIKEW